MFSACLPLRFQFNFFQEYEKPEEYDSNDRVGKLADKVSWTITYSVQNTQVPC
jgi:hypothetical protein